jgi:multidrug efflux pump subunit AcrB
MSWNPFDLFGSGPCVLVRLTPAEQSKIPREKVIAAIRKRLEAFEEAAVRLRDVSQSGRVPVCGYPIDLAIDGPEAVRVRAWANELGARLGRSKKLTDVWVSRDGEPRAWQFAEVDREMVASRGVSVQAVMNTLQIYLGGQHVGDINAFGRPWPIEVVADAGFRDRMRDLRQVKIRNSRGQMIPLSAFVTLRETTQPLALNYLDGRPMMEITANPATGVSVQEARKLCETLAEAARNDLGLGAAYRLSWLGNN